jgi:cyclic pyranopterin phosphate synthase
MLDPYKRNITYLRISVTDRCNLRCIYCMPEEGVNWIPHDQILSFEEILELVKVATKLGINKVRLTGGEPLVRKGVVDLVDQLAKVDGIKDISMTTNGILLDRYARQLFKAGMRRINISLDSLNEEKYQRMSRNGRMRDAIKGIFTAKKAGFHPIKINMVVNSQTSTIEKQNMKAFCLQNGLQIRYIHEMNLEQGNFTKVEGGDGGNCTLCNRIRLTAKGDIIPCLFSSSGYNVRELGAETALRIAIGLKPENGQTNQVNSFYNIGG